MKFILKSINKMDPLFQKGGKLERLHPLWEATVTFAFTLDRSTSHGPHVRDSLDLKRYMFTVVIALIPATLFGMYNTGYQSALAFGEVDRLTHWQIFANGALVALPIIVVSYVVGGLWEVLFSLVRKHPVSEGFLVTGLLFPLTLPPTIPLWQVAVGVTFGVVIGKEIFGGTGMNVLNPALTGRVFLFFSFPRDISGDSVWGVLDPSRLLYHFNDTLVDTYTGATALLVSASTGQGADAVSALTTTPFHNYDLWNLALGLIPGSLGETSALAILLGALILLISGVASWEVMFSTVVGAVAMAGFMNWLMGPDLSGYLSLPPHYHLVMGGFLLGAVFMTTDPVSSAATTPGKFLYGGMIGILTILVRVWNPAYPEGMMLSILFMNIFAPTIDYFVIRRNVKRRMKRATAK